MSAVGLFIYLFLRQECFFFFQNAYTTDWKPYISLQFPILYENPGTDCQKCLPISSNPLCISIPFHLPPVAVTVSPEASKTSQAVNGKQKAPELTRWLKEQKEKKKTNSEKGWIRRRG
ncbi:hypothetical protein CEXT_548961 [Caerostris extrusa]|uniref:Secreted protein n=1 Tax=Caerostris extrusa TaxID=172846 RepID=A0AAV4RD20_CAEEX|nr:hypothetical protein CEXT_548961 [Caerostris extrusa]